VQSVRDYIAIGPYTRDIPGRPVLPAGQSIAHLVAIAEKPTPNATIHWFLCDSDDEIR